jgi:uncharacterized protein YyaL (SSP411 family)
MAASGAGCLLAGFLLLLPGLPAAAAAQAPTNRLAGHPSPYLALHAADPVAWQEWNAETIARARRENKLLFVSVGYFACHWCHVMQRESYRNGAIAARLDDNFIPVKVDRELHAGLDAALQAFSTRLVGVAGWPLNAFVTPDGYPLSVVLYVPPQDLAGVLDRIAARWAAEPDTLRALARRAAPPASVPPRAAPLTAARGTDAWHQFLAAAWREADLLHGGFGEVAKFPMAPQLDALLARQARHPDAGLADFLRLTFDQMAARGLRDHVGGGFFRYTVDPGWETPHFEKMLADNAQLAALFLRAATVLEEPRYREVARAALDFMLRDLGTPGGGFQAGTSAVDAGGREGAFYLWEPDTLERHLPPAVYAAVRRVWRLDAPRVFEYGYLPAEYRAPTAAERPLLAAAATILLPLRQARSLPRDTKMNAGLNGLALSALSQGAGLDPAYRRAADRLQRFLLTHMVRDGQLLKSIAGATGIEGAELEDYAGVVTGLLDYGDATGNRAAQDAARRLAHRAWQRFWSKAGWRHEATPLLATVTPVAGLPDGAQPSPVDTLIRASLRLDDARLRRLAREAAAWRLPDMARDPLGWSGRVRVLNAFN